MQTRKSGVDWRARCLAERKAHQAEIKKVAALLDKIHTYATLAEYVIDNHNFGFCKDYIRETINAILKSGYVQPRPQGGVNA